MRLFDGGFDAVGIAWSLAAKRNNMAADAIAPIGLAILFPAMSGAEPWIGSKRSTLPPMLAEPNIPSEPARTADSSESMSPNKFSVTTTSKRDG